MKKNWFLLPLALLTCMVLAQRAMADEVWSTEQSDVIYQEDRNSTAIWSFGSDGLIFIDGLAGEYTNRGSYTGYWVQDSSSLRCDTYREGANGEPTQYWGRFEITFIDAEFPSRWHAHLSRCDREPSIFLNGTPVTR